MKGVYFGVVSILWDGVRHTGFFSMVADSESSALGAMILDARKRFPQGPIENTAVYRVSDEVVREVAKYLG